MSGVLVVVTTRKKLGSPIKSLSLDVLLPEQSLELLTVLIGEIRVQQELEIATTLCNWLEHLPLAIELVGHYLLERADLSLSSLLFRLQEKAQQRQGTKHAAFKQNEEISVLTHRHGLEAAFELSWSELDNNSQHLGKLLSLFASAPIPWSLVEAVEQKYCEGCDQIFDAELLEESRIKLLYWYLLKINSVSSQIYRLHSLVREFFRSKLEGEADVDY